MQRQDPYVDSHWPQNRNETQARGREGAAESKTNRPWLGPERSKGHRLGLDVGVGTQSEAKEEVESGKRDQGCAGHRQGERHVDTETGTKY